MRFFGNMTQTQIAQEIGISQMHVSRLLAAALHKLRRSLGKLVDGQGGVGAEFRSTLAVYFEESGSPQRAAKRLHIHPNTVTYRLRRIEEITGLSLDAHRERLMAEVAVAILAALGEL